MARSHARVDIRRRGREGHRNLRDPRSGRGIDGPAHGFERLGVGAGPDDDPLAPRSVGRFPHELVETIERPRAHFVVFEHERLDVREQRPLTEIELDHRGHVRIHGLVVGHTVAEEVRDRDVARARRVDDARAAQHRRGIEVEGVEALVVDAAIDHVDALLTAGREHVEHVVAAHEVATLDELDTHLPREERVLEVRGVVHARGQQHDARVVDAARRGCDQRLQEPRRIVGNGLHAVRGEQLGEHVGHRPPVLDDVRDPRRDPDVVLEHAHLSRRVAYEVDAGHVHAHAARRRDSAASRAVEVRRRDDEPPGNDPRPHDLARPVHVVEESFERTHTLRDTPLDQRPLGRGDDPGDEVERERPLLARVRERDALVAEDAVAGDAPLVEVLLRQRLHMLIERAVVEPRFAFRVEHLVPRVDRLIGVEQITHYAHPGLCADRRRVSPMKQRYLLPAVNLTTALACASMDASANAAERERWNDEDWIAVWLRRERFAATVTPYLLDAVALAPGENALDIGCGGGRTTIEAAERVGPLGHVTGADLSDRLLEVASDRARDANAANLEFQLADMQSDSVAGAPFDVAFSQFGVMFFDEPVPAFRNIAGHLRPEGRLLFACWQAAARNPWNVGAALSAFVAPPPPPAPGKAPTGPFALADPARTEGILRDAGFSGVRRTAFDITVEQPEDAVTNDDQLLSIGIAADVIPAARRALDEHMAQFRLPGGLSRFPVSFQIFAAHRPA